MNGMYQQPPKKKRGLTSTDKFWITVLILLGIYLLLTQVTAMAAGLIVILLAPFALVILIVWLLWRAGNRETVVLPPQYVNNAGWYPDQNDPRFMRWWDGHQWTSATLPR